MSEGKALMSGTEALVRLLLERKLEVKFKNALITKFSDPKKLKERPETFEAQLDIALEVKGYGHIKRKSLETAILALQ